MSLKPKQPKPQKTKRQTQSKPKKMTKAQVRSKLLNFNGSGWTSKMVDNAQEFQWGGHKYPVTLADKYDILHEHRQKLVAPLIEGRFKLPKIDRDSFIQQEEAYDGEKTDIVYSYKIPKIAQEWCKKNQRTYLDYIDRIYGAEFARNYFSVEQEALKKTFGERATRLSNELYEEEEEVSEGRYYKQVWNEWHPDAKEIMSNY